MKNKRLIITAIILIFLTIALILISKELAHFERNVTYKSNCLLKAHINGDKHCESLIWLKDDFTFIQEDGCIVIKKTEGKYWISNDTIYFDKKYSFAIIQELEYYTEEPYVLRLFKNNSDTIGVGYLFVKHYLNIKPTEKQISDGTFIKY